MVASASSKYLNMTPVSVSEETISVILDNTTFVDIVPQQIKSITNVTVTPINTLAYQNFANMNLNKFGSAVVDFQLGATDGIRLTMAGAVFLGAQYILTLYGTTA